MRFDYVRSALRRYGPARSLALAAVLLTLAVPLPGCNGGQPGTNVPATNAPTNTSPGTTTSRVSKDLGMGTSRDGVIIVFFNANGNDEYAVTVSETGTGKAFLSIPGTKTPKHEIHKFSGKQDITITVTCSNGAVTLTTRDYPLTNEDAGKYSRFVFFDADDPARSIFTTPVGVIVRSN